MPQNCLTIIQVKLSNAYLYASVVHLYIVAQRKRKEKEKEKKDRIWGYWVKASLRKQINVLSHFIWPRNLTKPVAALSSG